MTSHDPLDQHITHALNTVADQVPVRDRLAEFDTEAVFPNVRRWRFAEMPALAGAAAFVVGLALVGGALLTLRNNTNEPSEPAVPVVTTSTTTTTTAAQIAEGAGGPCLDEQNNLIGEMGIQVRSGGRAVDGSAGPSTIGHCPGHPDHHEVSPSDQGGGQLNRPTIHVRQGAELFLTAPGYPGAEVEATWHHDSKPETAISVVLTPVGPTTWTFIAPDETGTNQLTVRLDWFEGDATYTVFVEIDELLNDSTGTPTSTTVPLATSSPNWPTVAPAQYLTVDSDGVQWWIAESLASSFAELDVDKAYLIGSTIVFDTVSTSDIYAYPAPADAPGTAPGGSGGLLFNHFSETQMRLQDIVVVDGRAKAIVEEISEFNFGDELTSGEHLVSRELMLYDLESGDRKLLIDIPERRSGLDTRLANGSVVKVSATSGLVAVSLRTNTESWFELFTIEGESVASGLPYQQPVIDAQNVMAAISPDESKVAVAFDNRIELWSIDGALLREWTVARDGFVTHLDFDGYRVAGTVGSTLGEAAIGSFTLEIDDFRVISDAAAARITFAGPTTKEDALPLFEEPLRDASDPRSVFDLFESEVIDLAGGNGRIGLIGGDEVITFVCTYDDDEAMHPNTNLVVGPDESGDYESLLAAAESIARERACVPGLLGPFECLGIGSDPAACSE